MPKLTPEYIKEKLELIRSPYLSKIRQENLDRYNMYHGSIKDVVERTIKNEFKPETVKELIQRLVPINVMQKIINKLANVYLEYPSRYPSDRNEMDQELLNLYETGMDLNTRQKESNRHFKLYKKSLQEIFVNSYGIPSIRNLPAHTYEVFSDNPLEPECPEVVVKFLRLGQHREDERYAFWTDEEHLVVNGKGEVVIDEMLKINNIEGVNPIGKMPFIYVNESSYSIFPVPEDDLFRMSVVIPLLLSDLCFATKYLSWSVIYTIGVSGDLSFSPNSVVSLDLGPSGERPEIGTIKPNVSIQETLRFVEFLIAILLTTKNLSTSSIQGQLTAQTAASGVSKALDTAESIEDKKDQQGYFYKAERQLWMLISNYMIPYWRKNKSLAPQFNREFSSVFDLSIVFKEPKPLQSEDMQIEISKKKIDYGFSTYAREISNLYPDFDESEVQLLMDEIQQEKNESHQNMLNQFANVVPIGQDTNNGKDKTLNNYA